MKHTAPIYRASRARLAALAAAALIVAGCGGDTPDKLVASAKDYIAKRDFRGAELQLKNALQKEPTRADARFLLGEVMLQTGDLASAEKEFRRALEYKHPPEAVYPLLARAVLRQSDVDAVRKGIGELREVKLADPSAQAVLKTELGYAYLALRQPNDARAAFAEALAAKPGDPAARIGQARLLGANRDLDGAMKVVEEVLAQTPALPEALVLKAEIYLARGETDAALGALREVVKAEPRNGNARSTIVTLLVDAKKFDDAEAELGVMKKAVPRDIRGRYLEALIAFRRGEPAKAKDPILQVLKAVPDYAPALLLAGAIEYQLGQFVTAEDHLRKVVGRSPGNIYARNLLASNYLRLGQPGRAQETIQPALAAAPKEPSVLRVAGQIAVASNDPKRAMEYFERAAAVAKDDPGARIRLGAVRLATGDSDGALRDMEAAAELDSDAYMADIGLIVAHVSRKEIDKALAAVDRLAKKQPQSAGPENLRGLVYLARGDSKSARAAFEKALELQPDFLPAAASLARLDIMASQPEAARKRFEAIVAKKPTNKQALLALAEIQGATGVPPKEILPTVDRAVAANPTSVRARLVQIGLHARMDNPKAALAAAQSAAAALPDNFQILEALGQVQLAAGEPNQAIASFNKLAAMLPNSSGPLMLVARAHVAKKDFSAATSTLQKALTVQPGRLDVYRDAIATYIAAGKPAEALADARAVQKARPKEAIGFVFEGEVLIVEKKFDQAARAYGEAIKRQPEPLLVLRQRALLEAAGKRSEGEAAIARWLRENPKDPVVRLYLADRELSAKNYKAAATTYQQIIADQPSNALAMNNLAWTLWELKDPTALRYAEKAVLLAPKSPAVADTYGWLLLESGDTKRGTEILGRASKAAPNAHAIRLHYAKALIKSGEKAAAKQELEQIAQAQGESPVKAEAEQLLKQLYDAPMTTIAVVGLGYVGLPLAVEFGKKHPTIGFDLSGAKVDAYRRHLDPTGEVSTDELRAAKQLRVTTDPQALREADFVIVAVPTPIDEAHQPDFRPLLGASESVGRNLKRGATVVFESTVYPGATEEICVPVLERHSNLAWKRDFFVGYSPERINPGDKEHTLTRITKVVAGDTPETLERVAGVYSSVVTAGVHRASSIKVAEAAKVIENTQRDLNIALMNELALIFHRVGIDTQEVLHAAGTKWNFLPFRPGLVGGHCIGVDPYYLTHKAEMLGYFPQVILAGRRINDGMGKYVAEQTVKQLIQHGSAVKGADVIVLGLTFKEDVPDLRNSRVIDVVRELESYGARVHVHDPVALAVDAEHEYGVKLVAWDDLPRAAAIVGAVAHRAFKARPLDDFVAKLAPGGLYVDVKSQMDAATLAARGLRVWRL